MWAYLLHFLFSSSRRNQNSPTTQPASSVLFFTFFNFIFIFCICLSCGTCVGWSVWLLGQIFGMPPLLLTLLEPASPGPPTVLTRVRCLSLKPDMDREVSSHPDSRICSKVRSWNSGLSRVLRTDDHQNHPELHHVNSWHYRLRHQFCTLKRQTRKAYG